jgi:two-component system sensor histidine kinase RegB
MLSLSYHKNLKLLCWLRSIAIAGQAAAILAATLVLQLPLDTFPLWCILGAMAGINILTFARTRSLRPLSENEFFAQLVIDITALFGLLYCTGGATNPFAPLFILQVIIAAITLTPLYTWLAAALTIVFYTVLMQYHMDVPSLMHHGMMMDMGNAMFSLHVQGMWLSFVILAVIVAWFVVRMNVTIRRQDALLAEAEKMAAIGTLAANAAHELGTPLATLSILAEDAGPNGPMFREQLQRCKQILSRITAAGGVMRAQGGAPIALDTFLRGIVEHWQQDNPAVALGVSIQQGSAPRILGEYGLSQAISNLLDNAADASPEAVRIDAAWTQQALTLAIADKGSGLPQVIARTVGEAGVTTKPDGLGLGLFLARSVIHRMEGTLDLLQPASGGVTARIVLPLRRLAV